MGRCERFQRSAGTEPFGLIFCCVVAHVGDQCPHPRAETAALMLFHQGDEVLLKLVLALRNDQSALQQDRTQLVDQRRSFAHQPIGRPVQRLHLERIAALYAKAISPRPSLSARRR